MASTNQKTYLSVGVVFLLLVLLHTFGFLSRLENFIYSVSIPALSSLHTLSIKTGDTYQFFKDRDSFIAAYQNCVAANENNAVTQAAIKTTTLENDELKKQLNFKERSKIFSVTATVIGKEIESSAQSIIIDKGWQDKIKINQPVIGGAGILIGKISKVEGHIAFVRLLNDNQSKITATVLGHSQSLGVVEGGYGISLRMNLIPRDEVVLVGDQIITSGLEINIPRGLLLGSVAVVENEPYKPFQQAVLTPATDLNKITIVSVLLTN